MADDKKIRVIIEYSSNDKEAVAAAKRLQSALQNTGKKGSEAIDGMSTSTLAFAEAAGNFIGGVAKGAFDVLTSKIEQGTAALFNYTSQLEVTRKQFDQLTGSSSSTKQVLDDIRKFATDKGLDVGFVSDTEKEMMRLQVSSKDTLKTLDTMADTVASIGGDEKMTQRLTSISTEIIKSGRLSLDAINQITDVGVPAERVWSALEKQTGKTRIELMYLARDSKLSSQVIFDSLENFNKANNFGDAAEKQTQTFSGALNKLSNILLTEGEKAFEPYFNKISEFTQKTAESIQEKGIWATTGELIGQGIAAGIMIPLKDLPQQLAEYMVNETSSAIEKLKRGDYAGAGEQLPGSGIASFARNISNGILKYFGYDDPMKSYQDSLKLQKAVPTENGLKLPNPFNPEYFQKQLEQQKKIFEQGYRERLDVISQFQRIEEAQINAHLRLTSQDEIKYANDMKFVRQSAIKQRIEVEARYYDKQIALAKDDTKTITQLTIDKNKVLRGLSTDYALAEISSQQQIQQIERKILEQRRQTQIQFKNLQIRELSLSADSKSFDINRSISLGVNVQGSFEQLKNLTQTNYQQIAEITKQSYEIQLKNERLTSEERINLNKQMYLELQNLAEQNREKQIEIQDNQFKQIVSRIEQQRSFIQDAYQGQADIYSGINRIFSPESFNSNTSQKLKDIFITPIVEAEKKYRELQQRQMSISDDGKGEFSTKIPQESFNKLVANANEAFQIWEKLRKSTTGVTEEILKLADGLSTGTLGIKTFDEANKRLLDSQHRLQMANLQSEIDTVKTLIDLEQKRLKAEFDSNPANKGLKFVLDSAASPQITELQNRLKKTESAETSLRLTQAAESLDQYNNSLEGMRQNLEKLLNGDADAWLGFYYNLEKTNINNQISQIKELATAQDRLTKSTQINTLTIRAQIYEHIAQAKTYSEAIADGINQTYDAVAKKATSTLDKLNEKTKGFLSFFIEPLKAVEEKKVSNIFTNIVDKVFPGFGDLSKTQTSNPIAKPIVSEISQSNNYLKRIADAVTRPSSVSNGRSSTSAGINSIGDIINLASGGNLGSRSGINSPAIFNAQPLSTSGDITRTLTLPNGQSYTAGSTWTQIKSIFGKGGIFGEQGFGFNSGTIQGIGGIAGMAGGMIGGGAGDILSGVSMGIGTASSLATILGISALGGPVGLAIGAAIGGTIGLVKWLFGRSKQRKADEATRDKLVGDALTQLTKIKSEMDEAKSGINIQSLIDNALQIQTDYYTQANALKDKKTRQNAVIIGHDRIDPMVSAIQESAKTAKIKESMRASADEKDRRILPEFKTGGFIPHLATGDYFKPNGLIPGMFDRKDDILAMLSRGEMVLNPVQQERIRRMSGFDVFAHADIPNYRQSKTTMPKFADGVNFGSASVGSTSLTPQIIFSPNINIWIEKNDVTGEIEAWMDSPKGKRKLNVNVTEGFKNDQIKTDRR
ncbi:MAG: hypothetical protein K1X72_04250 [Pyrinomonadaceae bacterium]|nr:hypothetical protein [Pyrinomonadaceae bacterium]